MIKDIFLVAVSDGIAQGADDGSRVPTGGRHQATDCRPKSQVSLLLHCCPVLKVLYFCYLYIIHWEVLCFTTTHPAQPSTHVSISLIIYMCICQQSFERSHVFWTSPSPPTLVSMSLTVILHIYIYVYLPAELWKVPCVLNLPLPPNPCQYVFNRNLTHIYMCICQQSFERSHVFWTSPSPPTLVSMSLTVILHIYICVSASRALKGPMCFEPPPPPQPLSVCL